MNHSISIAAMLALCFAWAPRVHAQATPYVGQIAIFAFNFCPVGWLPLEGQTLAISEFSVLFDLLGTTYGGNGTTTFLLPNWSRINTANGGVFTPCIATQGIFPSPS